MNSGIKSFILKFADDTKVFGRVLNPSESSQLQDDINTFIKWSEDWQMLFHVGKCKIMHYCTLVEQISFMIII